MNAIHPPGKYTEGPWRFMEFGARGGDGPTEFRIGRDGVLVASTLGYSMEAEANARLISTAPDLLTELEWFHFHLHVATVEDCTVGGCRAKAVVARARGLS